MIALTVFHHKWAKNQYTAKVQPTYVKIPVSLISSQNATIGEF